MPFLILPADRAISDRQLSALSSRLCPYSEPPRKAPGTADFTIWATSLATSGPEHIRHTLNTGTAGFEVRIQGETLAIATDALGTCPIWYARCEEGWIVSPEAKAIAITMSLVLRPSAELIMAGRRPADWSPFENLFRLPPGSRLLLTKKRAVTEGEPQRFEPLASSDAAGGDWGRRLGEALVDAFAPSKEATGSFVSGGIDSSIACSLARRHGPVTTFSLGTAYGNEFQDARFLADALGCSHREVQLEASDVSGELERVIFQNEVFDGLTAEILLQLSALYGAAAGSCRRITTGYGSDLLFDGMLRHPAYLAAVGLESTPELIERTRWTGELAPFVHWSRGVSADHVFWKTSVIELALRVPRPLCLVDGVEKHVLREGAVRVGLLPKALAFRKKTALSEGTGANRLLSATLGIAEPYGYGEKSLACVDRLKRLF